MRERLGAWLWRWAQREALPLALLLGLGGLLAFTVDEAGWVKGSRLGWGTLAALLVGAALARSRFKGWSALGYGLVLLLAGAAQHVGRVLAGLGLLWAAPGEWVWTLHLRTLTLGARVAGWVETLRTGQAVQDPGLFLGLASLAAWGAAGWLAWAALRRQQALGAVVPAGVLLAANLHLSGQSWLYLLLYAVLGVGLMVLTAYEQQQAGWETRALDYPVEMGLDWGGAAFGVMVIAAALAAAAPLAGTPAGWRLMAALVDASRREAAETAGQLFGGVTAPQVPAALRAITPDLSVIGRPIEQSQETIMWVRVSDPAPRPEHAPGAVEAPPQHYWRSGLFATYTGTGWQPLSQAPGPGGVPEQAPEVPPPGRYPLRQSYEILAENGPALFAVNVPVTASAGAQVVALAGDGTALVSGPAAEYGVISWATRVTEAELRAASAELPPELAALYLQVPEALPGRVRDLAGQIVRAAGNDYDRALRLQNYLRANYAYLPDVPAAPAGRDAVDYFLFEAPGGFCSYYASAMAVMLRTLGVPARLAAGYATGVYDPARGAYRVPAAAAHAWVEVYFAGYGWVEFEPTAARPAFTREPGQAQAQGTLGAPALPPEAERAERQAPGWLAAAAASLALAALAGRWLLARRTGQPRSPRARALRLYDRLRRALARAGLAGGPNQTPDEYQAGAAGRLSARDHRLAAALAQATALHEQAAYSARPVGAGQVAAVERLWRRARLAHLRLWLRHAWPRGGKA
jgi:transglutaminase-like putative cysteine protease